MIRDAYLSDMDVLVELTRIYHEESNMERCSFDHTTTRANLYRGIGSSDAVVKVKEENGEIIGFSFSIIEEPLFSKDKVMDCSLLYVNESNRKGSNGVQLIKQLKKDGKLHDVKYVYVGNNGGVNTDRVARLYNSLGYSQIGNEFRQEIL